MKPATPWKDRPGQADEFVLADRNFRSRYTDYCCVVVRATHLLTAEKSSQGQLSHFVLPYRKFFSSFLVSSF